MSMANSQLLKIQYTSNESKPLTCKCLLKKMFKRNIVFNSLSTYTCLKWVGCHMQPKGPQTPLRVAKYRHFLFRKMEILPLHVQMTVVNSNQKQAQQCLLEKLK